VIPKQATEQYPLSESGRLFHTEAAVQTKERPP